MAFEEIKRAYEQFSYICNVKKHIYNTNWASYNAENIFSISPKEQKRLKNHIKKCLDRVKKAEAKINVLEQKLETDLQNDEALAEVKNNYLQSKENLEKMHNLYPIINFW